MRPYRLFDSCQFFHQVLVYLKPSCCINNQDIKAFFFGFLTGVYRYFLSRTVITFHIHRNSHGPANNFQLIDCCRPVYITGTEHWFFTVLLKIAGQLAAGGGLTGTLQTHHQQYCETAG